MLKDKTDKWLKEFQIKHGFNLAWFIRYAIGGTVTVIIEYGAMFLLCWWTLPWDAIVSILPQSIRVTAANELETWAIAMSNIISYVVNYFISKYWVFRSPDTKHSRDASLFILSCVVNLLLVTALAKGFLILLGFFSFSGDLWDAAVPTIAKTGSNIVAYVSVLLFKRFIIWNDTSKY